MNARAQYHNDTGRDFLASARTHLAADDLLQASEKGWGAAAQMVKCAAEDRGWIHNGHRQLYLTIDRLADETGDPQLRDLFATASALHANFYDGWMPPKMVESSLGQVVELVGKLEGLTG